VRVEFQCGFTIGIYFRAKVIQISSGVNSQSDSPKGTNVALIRGSGLWFLWASFLAGKGRVVTVAVAKAAPSTVLCQVRLVIIRSTLCRRGELGDRRGSRGHGCLELSDLAVQAGRIAPIALGGSSPGRLIRVLQLPMLGLLGRGKGQIDVGRVSLVLDPGHLVDFLLGNKPEGTRHTTTSTATATAGPAAASTATTASLSQGGNGAACGRIVVLLGPLEVAIQVHDSGEVLEFCAVGQDHGLGGGQGFILDSFFKIVDLHVLVNALYPILLECGQSIVLLHVGSAILVEVPVLEVALVGQYLEVPDDFRVHGVNPVLPKEEGVQGAPDLAAILRGRVLLDVLPSPSSGILGMEDDIDLLRVSEEGYMEWARGL
jgi:hypothetical protein